MIFGPALCKVFFVLCAVIINVIIYVYIKGLSSLSRQTKYLLLAWISLLFCLGYFIWDYLDFRQDKDWLSFLFGVSSSYLLSSYYLQKIFFTKAHSRSHRFYLAWNLRKYNGLETQAALEQIRQEYRLPALGVAVLSAHGQIESSVVGVRKTQTTIAVQLDDCWHLGSNTKAMTSLLVGSFVAEGRLQWEDRVLKFFPELAQTSDAKLRNITVRELLAHEAGLKTNLEWFKIGIQSDLRQQRLEAVRQGLSKAQSKPRIFYAYSNLGYVVAGALLERLSGISWEVLMRTRLFLPLGMATAGFGGTGTEGEIDQPWPHLANGKPAPSNGPKMDNAACMGPAGTVHCSLADYTAFLLDQLRGCRGQKALIEGDFYRRIQQPSLISDYSLGWLVEDRSWVETTQLTHSGSNTTNYALAWLVPALNFGVLVCTNQGGTAAASACARVANLMKRRYLITTKGAHLLGVS